MGPSFWPHLFALILIAQIAGELIGFRDLLLGLIVLYSSKGKNHHFR